MGNLLFVAYDDREVAVYQVQALEDRVGLVKTGLWENQHHKCVQQLLVFDQLHVATSHFCREI